VSAAVVGPEFAKELLENLRRKSDFVDELNRDARRHRLFVEGRYFHSPPANRLSVRARVSEIRDVVLEGVYVIRKDANQVRCDVQLNFDCVAKVTGHILLNEGYESIECDESERVRTRAMLTLSLHANDIHIESLSLRDMFVKLDRLGRQLTDMWIGH
jgi:hypothetical protein